LTFKTDYQTWIFKSRYARWLDDKGRRETFEETVTRYCDFWQKRYPDIFPYDEVYQGIYNLETLPSMRALMTAGPALERDNIAGFNCSYIPIQDQRCFDEILYILTCGTGVGYSVERRYVDKLPEVAESFHGTASCITVADSRQGWAGAFRQLVSLLYAGQVPRWDTSNVRPAGARLKTFGGRASGPEPLEDLFRFTVSLFTKAAGRKLTSIECSDLVCKIAEVVVVGGVRRSALICLSNLTDERMRNYKNGQWWLDSKHRALANISAVYTEAPDPGIFMKEWHAL
jgi:ribonucleoside-triphosphate reductase